MRTSFAYANDVGMTVVRICERLSSTPTVLPRIQSGIQNCLQRPTCTLQRRLFDSRTYSYNRRGITEVSDYQNNQLSHDHLCLFKPEWTIKSDFQGTIWFNAPQGRLGQENGLQWLQCMGLIASPSPFRSPNPSSVVVRKCERPPIVPFLAV